VKERIEGTNAKWCISMALLYSENFPKEKEKGKEEKDNQSPFDHKTVSTLAHLVVALTINEKRYLIDIGTKLNEVHLLDINALAKEVFGFATSNFSDSFRKFFCSSYFSNNQFLFFHFSNFNFYFNHFYFLFYFPILLK
jgi:hypothetical protein